MALSFVGGNSGGALGSTGTTFDISLTALTGGSGSAAQEGDIVIVVVASASTAARAIGVNTSGYTQVADVLGVDNYYTNLTVWWKAMGATPDTVVTISPSGSTADGICAAVHVWRGANTSSPFDVTGVSANGANSGQPDPPAITPVSSGAVVLACGAYALNTGGTLTSSDLSNFISVALLSETYEPTLGLGSYAWTSGTFDPAQFGGGSTSTSSSWAAFTMALQPIVLSPTRTPGPASVTTTGEAPTVSVLVDPGASSVAITGEAPAPFVDYGSASIAIGQVALTITSEVPVGAIDIPFGPTDAAVAVAGTAPAIALSDNRTIQVAEASMVALAEVPVLVEGVNASPPSTTLAIGTATPNTVQNELPSPGETTSTITGYQVTLQRLFSANTEAGALAIAGAAPSLLESGATIMQPAAAALAITGQAPVADLGSVPIPSATALTVLGAAPALRLDMVCSPGARSLLTNWLVTADSTDTVDGEGPTDGIVIQTAPTVVVSDHAIAQPGAGSATVTTQAPSAAVTTGVWSEPSAGSIAITGQQPTVAQTTSQYPSPNPCTITVDCIGPTPVVGTVIGVPVATVAITAAAPSAVTDTRLVISGEAPVIGVAGPGNMVMSVIRLYGSLDGGRDVRLKWPEN